MPPTPPSFPALQGSRDIWFKDEGLLYGGGLPVQYGDDLVTVQLGKFDF